MNSAPEDLDPNRLLALLTEQRELYGRLRELSQRQRTLIVGDRPELLLNILRDRQNLVAALARLNEKLGPFRRVWDELVAGLPEPARRQTSALLDEINGLLRCILETDRQDSALLSARRRVVAQELSDAAGGCAANTAYAHQSAADLLARSSDLSG